MSEYFLKPKSFGGRAKFELDWYNYARKADLKNTASVDTSKFVEKFDLAILKSKNNKSEKVPNDLNSLKSKVGILDADKLVPFLLI